MREKIINRLIKILPHISLILACMFIVFMILDILNPTMDFTGCRISDKLMWVLCVTTIFTSVSAIYLSRK